MFDWSIYLHGLAAMTALGLLGWLASLARNNVTIVDSMWGLFFLLGTAAYIHAQPGTRAGLLLALVALWALRLSIFLAWRNRLFASSAHEDRRYASIRVNNAPYFRLKSLYLVFGLQSVLAWVISLPLLTAAISPVPLHWLDGAGVLLWAFGFAWESIADRQLARFKAQPENRGRVLTWGLWRYSRHPNYFGECCLWWGYYLLAFAAGGWWTLPAPMLMTWLLLRFSGVPMLEHGIAARRPAYADYMRSTNAFLPGRPRSISSAEAP